MPFPAICLPVRRKDQCIPAQDERAFLVASDVDVRKVSLDMMDHDTPVGVHGVAAEVGDVGVVERLLLIGRDAAVVARGDLRVRHLHDLDAHAPRGVVHELALHVLAERIERRAARRLVFIGDEAPGADDSGIVAIGCKRKKAKRQSGDRD